MCEHECTEHGQRMSFGFLMRSVGLWSIPYSLRAPLRTLRSVVSLFPVFHCFDHAYIGTLIEDGLLGDTIVQMRIQIQCLFVPLSDMQRDFGIVVLACLLLRTLHQERADP